MLDKNYLVQKYTNPENEKNFGFYQIWSGHSAPTQFVWGFTIQDYETLQYDHEAMTLISDNKVINLDSNKNYYITRNPMRSAKKRGNNEIRGITHLVIDIDRISADEPEKSYYEAAKHVLWLINRDLVETNEILPFSKVVFSGRGLQLHYEIQQIAPFNIFISLADMLLNKITNQIEKLLLDYDLDNTYSVDLSASRNHAGLVRLAGVNQKSNEIIKHYNSNKKYTLNQLLIFFEIGQEKKTRTEHVSKTVTKASDLHRGRLTKLEQIQAIRIESKNFKGYRNKLVFLYFNSLIALKESDPLTKVYHFNNNFPNPIKKSEIEAMKRYLNESGYLRFKSETFYGKWLEVTEKEKKEIKTIDNRKRNHSEVGKEARQKQKIKEKEQRHYRNKYERDKRLNVLRDKTTTNKEKAALLNVSISTIQRLKREFKDIL